MKQVVDFNQQPKYIQEYIFLWKEKKHYLCDSKLNIGECIELLIATAYNLHFDNSDGRFFNKILINNESVIAWEGEELIDIIYYELIENIKLRINSSRTFNQEVA